VFKVSFSLLHSNVCFTHSPYSNKLTSRTSSEKGIFPLQHGSIACGCKSVSCSEPGGLCLQEKVVSYDASVR
jgi:hypothetical protein